MSDQLTCASVNTQYALPTQTRLICRVEWCRAMCRPTPAVTGGSRDPVSNSAANSTGYILNVLFSFQLFDQILRELVANSVHTADATQLHS